MDIQFSQQHLLKILVFHQWCFDIFVKNQFNTHVWVYFWALNSIILTYQSNLPPIPHCVDDCSFVVSFEIRKYESSNFLLFEDCFGVPCNSIRILGSTCQFLQKNSWNFDRDCSESVDQFGIQTILSLPKYKQGMSFH